MRSASLFYSWPYYSRSHRLQKTLDDHLRRPPWEILRDHLGGPCKTTSEDLGIPPWKTTLEELGRPIRNTLEDLTLLTGNPLCLEGVTIKILKVLILGAKFFHMV